MDFKNKITLITGAASGIGRAAALAFAEKGATVIVSDVNEKGGAETVAKIEAAGGQSIFIKTNVAIFTEVEKMISQIVEKYGRLDIAVNNAGIGGQLGKTADASIENWERVMSINSTGVFYCLKLEIGQMLKQGGGVIVNTASIAGLKGLPNSSAYTASKHAVVGMTRSSAMEYATKNIRINALCPAFTVTALFDPQMMDNHKAGISEKLKAAIPMKRFGEVDEQVNALLWLCSDQSSFVTGLALPVDGGVMA